MKANKLFNPLDYLDPHFSKMKKLFEEIYADMQRQKVLFEYSDWNRAWEYAIMTKFTEPNSKKVLDIGSGKSLFPIALSGFFHADVTSVDVQDLKERYILAGINNQEISIIKANAIDLPFKDNLFDIVYLVSVIEHIKNPIVALEEAVRVCKPGGYIGITTDFSEKIVNDDVVKSGQTFDEKVINQLLKFVKDTKMKVKPLNEIDFKEVDLSKIENNAVKGNYTFISLIFKKDEALNK